MSNSRLKLTRNNRLLIIAALTLLAFFLRTYALNGQPPGWRDDELINSLVISQKALDGDIAVYYPDASGHEGLYHVLNAAFLGIFGAGTAGIRLLSAILGTLTIPMTYLLGRKLYSDGVGLVAALALAFSFWSLIYSRIGLRHILMPLLVLLTFYFFWKGLEEDDPQITQMNADSSRSVFNLRNLRNLRITIFWSWNYALAGLFMGLGFYAYFASRGVPLILLAFCGYIFLFARPLFKQKWKAWAMMFGLAALLALPLAITLRQQPESESRVAELAVPLVEARVGNFEPLKRHVITTLSMFHADGDDEWLYNIPHRPVFGPVGAIFFWTGALIAFYYALKPLATRSPPLAPRHSLPSAFLLFWWLAGISPGFISVPAASLGHTIVAQTAVYILAALPIWVAWRVASGERQVQKATQIGLALLLLGSVAARDLPDYFTEWPSRGMVRFLYRADLRELAVFLNINPTENVAVSSLLAGPWDQIAFEMGLDEDNPIAPRWFNPQRAMFLQPGVSYTGYPDVDSPYADWYTAVAHPKWEYIGAGGYRLSTVEREVEAERPICFQNGLCWNAVRYDADEGVLELGWTAVRPLNLPAMPLVSNPPPPGVYSGPRLWVFAQLQDANGNFLTGNDGFWVDPVTLQSDDWFLQRHRLILPEGVEAASAVFGLYDPMTGERVLTEDGREFIRIPLNNN